MYGGAAGGGKSDALLMGALQYVDVPRYAAIIFRLTYADLALPEALMDRAQEWLGPTDAVWHSAEHKLTFPSGASVSFGYLETQKDKYRYQSAAFQYIAFDELTQFAEDRYRYLFSRLRRPDGLGGTVPLARVPLRMRAASNPGGLGHEWVKQRFLTEGAAKGRVFIPAKLGDNPYLDQEEYRQSLAELDPVTRAQLLNGDWAARTAGGVFRREWFEIVPEAPAKPDKIVRFWDMAASVPKPGTDPDWTTGGRLSYKDGIWYLEDMRRVQASPHGVESLIVQTARLDGDLMPIRMEQEGGASGKTVIDFYSRGPLSGYNFLGRSPTASKLERAGPFATAAESGNVKLVQGAWIGEFLDEADAFPEGTWDDQIDACSGAMAEIRKGLHRPSRIIDTLAESARPRERHPLRDPDRPDHWDEPEPRAWRDRDV